MNGKVITFYSYKGGVGRSMAMANIGAMLALWGKKTILIDWDLEAPGLENYFKQGNETRITELNKKEGLIDLLLKRKSNANFSPNEIKWNEFISTLQITNSTNNDKPFTVDILTAGRKDDTYIKRVREMDYGSFYDDHKGGAFLEEIREYWIGRYDFVLIDSRTGLTDSSGVCSIQMPDVLVMLFTATDLGFKGTLEIAQRAIKAQKSIIYDRYSLKVLPIPTRFDSTEFKLQQDWLSKFEQGLKPIYSTWVPDYPQDDKINIDHRKILDLTKLPYIPYFSYGEALPVIEQGTDDPQGLGYAFETVAAIIAHDLEGAKLLVENRSEYVRRAIKSISPDKEEIKAAIPMAKKTNDRYFKWVGLLGLGILATLIYLVVAKNKTTNINEVSFEDVTDSFRKTLNIKDLQSFYYLNDTNNISSILELNKQIYAENLDEDKSESIAQIRQTILNRIKAELEFRLPLVYQEIKFYDSQKSIDLSSNKDVYDRLMNPIEKYFADTIFELGPFKSITNEQLQDKLKNKLLEGFENVIEKDSIHLISTDSFGFKVEYIEVGNYYFKDSVFTKSKINLGTPVSLSLNSDLKINKMIYKENIKTTVVLPSKKQTPLTRVEIFTVGNKTSRQLLQLDAIYEELNRNKAFLARKAGNNSKEKDLSGANEIRCNKSDLSRAQALQKLLLEQLNISFSIRTGDYTPNYLSIYLADDINRTNKAVQKILPNNKK